MPELFDPLCAAARVPVALADAGLGDRADAARADADRTVQFGRALGRRALPATFGLRPDAEPRRADLDRGLPPAERVTTERADGTGRRAVHDAVTTCCHRALAGEGDLVDPLPGDPVAGERTGRERNREQLHPDHCVGSAGTLVDCALAAYRKRKERQ